MKAPLDRAIRHGSPRDTIKVRVKHKNLQWERVETGGQHVEELC